MFKLKRIKFKKLKNFLKKLPRTLAEHSFLTFLGLLLVISIFGAIVFYYYINLTEISGGITEKEKPLNFNTETQQKVLDEWQKRSEKSLETDLKEYPNPFEVD